MSERSDTAKGKAMTDRAYQIQTRIGATFYCVVLPFGMAIAGCWINTLMGA